jgi:hypothetical protein
MALTRVGSISFRTSSVAVAPAVPIQQCTLSESSMDPDKIWERTAIVVRSQVAGIGPLGECCIPLHARSRCIPHNGLNTASNRYLIFGGQ